jgi:hypothetical protein
VERLAEGGDDPPELAGVGRGDEEDVPAVVAPEEEQAPGELDGDVAVGARMVNPHVGLDHRHSLPISPQRYVALPARGRL